MRRFGLLPSTVDNTLYDAFGERQVSTIYNAMNQCSVVMEVAPRYWQSPDTLKQLYVSTQGQNATGTQSTNAVVGTFTSSSNSTSGSKNNSMSRSTSSSVNRATNSLAVGGKSNASSGAPSPPQPEPNIPLPP